MSRRFKYIVIDGSYPVLFTEAQSHASRKREHDNVTSAGHGSLDFNEEGKLVVTCWGESIGLKVKADIRLDTALITRMFVED